MYVRELEDYSLHDLSEKLGFDETKTLKILNKMQHYNCVSFDWIKDKFQFNFVGIIIVENVVMKCYPKYIKHENNISKDFKQIIEVIRKFNESNEIDYENEILDDLSFNLLSLMIFFMEDYYKNGVYTSFKSIHEINGMGEINWDKSINHNFPVIQNNKPYYVELFTRKKLNDNYNYFRLLHECIITDCSNKLHNLDLLELLGLSEINLSDRNLDDFGDNGLLLNKIEKEMNVEFNSHKQKILKSMHSYISEQNSFSSQNFLTLYGTNKFYHIWENVCSEVIGNKLSIKLKNLSMPLELHESFDNMDINLKEIIEKPKWDFFGIKEFEKKTLIPDLITFNLENAEFLIFDAKYYDIDVNENKLEGQPGIGSIIKQYLYQLAYKEFIELNGFTKIKNAFLFPSEHDTQNKGLVKLNMLNSIKFDKDFSLQDIQIIFVSASYFYELYLNNDFIDVSYLNLM